MSLAPEVRRTTIPAPSGDLAALVGEPPAGSEGKPAALLVPGYSGSKEDFLPVLGPLARAGHRVVAIDMRGQYQSVGPDDPAAYSLDALAKDVAAVLADLGSPGGGAAHLVGHSFGGLVTRRAILTGARPCSHVLVGSGPAALGGHRAGIVEMMRPLLQEPDGLRQIADAAAEMDRDNPRMAGIPAEVRDFLYERWITSSARGLTVMGQELVQAVDEVDALAAIGVPTFVIYGETDDAWPPEVQRDMAERLGAAHAVIAGAVHSPACEEPKAFTVALLEYWSGLDSRGSGAQSE